MSEGGREGGSERVSMYVCMRACLYVCTCMCFFCLECNLEYREQMECDAERKW